MLFFLGFWTAQLSLASSRRQGPEKKQMEFEVTDATIRVSQGCRFFPYIKWSVYGPSGLSGSTTPVVYQVGDGPARIKFKWERTEQTKNNVFFLKAQLICLGFVASSGQACETIEATLVVPSFLLSRDQTPIKASSENGQLAVTLSFSSLQNTITDDFLLDNKRFQEQYAAFQEKTDEDDRERYTRVFASLKKSEAWLSDFERLNRLLPVLEHSTLVDGRMVRNATPPALFVFNLDQSARRALKDNKSGACRAWIQRAIDIARRDVLRECLTSKKETTDEQKTLVECEVLVSTTKLLLNASQVYFDDEQHLCEGAGAPSTTALSSAYHAAVMSKDKKTLPPEKAIEWARKQYLKAKHDKVLHIDVNNSSMGGRFQGMGGDDCESLSQTAVTTFALIQESGLLPLSSKYRALYVVGSICYDDQKEQVSEEARHARSHELQQQGAGVYSEGDDSKKSNPDCFGCHVFVVLMPETRFQAMLSKSGDFETLPTLLVESTEYTPGIQDTKTFAQRVGEEGVAQDEQRYAFWHKLFATAGGKPLESLLLFRVPQRALQRFVPQKTAAACYTSGYNELLFVDKQGQHSVRIEDLLHDSKKIRLQSTDVRGALKMDLDAPAAGQPVDLPDWFEAFPPSSLSVDEKSQKQQASCYVREVDWSVTSDLLKPALKKIGYTHSVKKLQLSCSVWVRQVDINKA
jgi:hypothetical protein